MGKPTIKKNKNDVIVSELKKVVRVGKGTVTPESVVGYAENLPKGNPLHDYFEWNNNKAAREYRIVQARELLRVTVDYLPHKTGGYVKVRAFQSLSPDRNKDGGYRITADVLNDEEMKKVLLADAIRELMAFQRKYHDLKELTVVFESIETVLHKSA